MSCSILGIHEVLQVLDLAELIILIRNIENVDESFPYKGIKNQTSQTPSLFSFVIQLILVSAFGGKN